MKVKRALISVTDKTDLIPFAKSLRKLGVEIFSTGGTLKLLKENGVNVRPIEELTGFPEILNGRLKTLHPRVHGGLLLVRGNPKQRREARAHGIEPIDLVVVNLYKFQETVAQKGVTETEAVEHIDIGGPAMLRSAAKNFKYVGVVSHPADYAAVIDELKRSGRQLSETTRKWLAAKAFEMTFRYDEAVAAYFSSRLSNGGLLKTAELPERLRLSYRKAQTLRYGENPHQRAAFYLPEGKCGVPWTQRQGKELSYNNLLDMESAIDLVSEFSAPAAAIIKHNNPCGVAEDKRLAQAVGFAIDGDPLSAFGGIVAVNRPVAEETARLLLERLTFFEVIASPGFGAGALEVFKERKNLRVMELDLKKFSAPLVWRHLQWGLLLQDRDRSEPGLTLDLKPVTRIKPTAAEIEALIFAWKCAKHVRSNAIVLVRNRRTVGIGAGQMSRVGSVHIACRQAGELAKGSVMASDGFFPMPDNIEVAHQHGVRFIIQPGGSVRDADVITACDRFGIGMVFTGKRHFRH